MRKKDADRLVTLFKKIGIELQLFQVRRGVWDVLFLHPNQKTTLEIREF